MMNVVFVQCESNIENHLPITLYVTYHNVSEVHQHYASLSNTEYEVYKTETVQKQLKYMLPLKFCHIVNREY